MCGPLSCAVLMPQPTKNRLPLQVLTYNASRIISYTLLGATLGLLHVSLGTFWHGSTKYIASGFGLVLIVIALLNIFSKNVPLLGSFESALSERPLNVLQKVLHRSSLKYRGVILGIMTAFLPCMTLTPAYLMAAATNNYLSAGVFMLGFGLGTLPVMFLTPTIGQELTRRIPATKAKLIAAFFLLFAGVVTLYRGLLL